MDDLQARIENYQKTRLEQYCGWYDKKAVQMKTKFLRGKIWSAIIAVIVPVLANLNIVAKFQTDFSIDISKVLVTVLSTLVALLIALEGVLHYDEQWKNYRTTEQFLTAQKNLFINRVGDYANLNDEEAFKLLVRRIEQAITEENALTLNVLTKVDNGGKQSATN